MKECTVVWKGTGIVMVLDMSPYLGERASFECVTDRATGSLERGPPATGGR